MDRRLRIKLYLLFLCATLLVSGLFAFQLFNRLHEIIEHSRGGKEYPLLSYWERVNFFWGKLEVSRYLQLSREADRPYNRAFALGSLFKLNQMLWVLLTSYLPLRIIRFSYYVVLVLLSLPLILNWRYAFYWLRRGILVILTLMLLLLIYAW